MTESLLAYLSGLLYGSWWMVLSGSLFWGIVSILLSPCHLASIPLLVGYVARENSADVKRSFLLSLVFSAGIFLVLLILGFITVALGRMAGDLGRPLSFILAFILIVVGIFITGAISLPDFGRGRSFTNKGRGYSGALILGIIYGAGLGPCAFAFMIPVFSIVMSLAHSNILYSVSVLVSFAVGHCSVIALAGLSAGAVTKWLSLNESSFILKSIRIICGILVSAGGLLIILNLFSFKI